MPELHTTKPEPKRHDFAAGETGRGPSVPSNGLANDPKAGQWDGRRMSKRMIADYKTNGDNIFEYFNAPKAKIIAHYARIITTILEKWPESPFAADLAEIELKISRI